MPSSAASWPWSTWASAIRSPSPRTTRRRCSTPTTRASAPELMNILVCVKRVPLTGGKIVLTDDERAISTRHLGFTVSPHEECGVEEAVRLIEQHGGSSTVLTLGPPEAEEQLRDMMALGIDRAVHLVTDAEEGDPQATGHALVAVIEDEPERYDLILFGNESADAGNHQV